jgi:hypothetical protein
MDVSPLITSTEFMILVVLAFLIYKSTGLTGLISLFTMVTMRHTVMVSGLSPER